MSLSNFPDLTKSINAAFILTPPTSTLSTTYGSTWTQLGNTFTAAQSDDVLASPYMSSDGGTVAYVTLRDDAGGFNRGSVRVFRWVNSTWTPLGSPFYGIVDSQTFSGSICLGPDGNTIAINYQEAPIWELNTSTKGFVAVFNYNSNKTSSSNDVTSSLFGPAGWSIVGAPIYNENNGDTVSIVRLSGNCKVIAIGIPYNDGTTGNINDQRGTVRVFAYDSTKVAEVTDQSSPNFGPIGWTRLGQDIDGVKTGDNQGSPIDISLDGTIIAVGIQGDDTLPNPSGSDSNIGAAKVFQWDGTTWTQRGRNMYVQFYDIYGNSVYFPSTMAMSANGNILALGTTRYASYRVIASTWIWNPVTSDYMPLASQLNEFGDWQLSGAVSLSSDGTILANGANDADNNILNGGTIRVYKLTTKSTTLISSAPSDMSAYISDINFSGVTANGTIYRVTITGAVTGGTVWGTNIYRHDSNLAMAAVHAGVVANGETKEVYVVMERPQIYWFGTTRQGVTSLNHGITGSDPYPLGSYGSYFFQTEPRHWLKIGNDIFGSSGQYLGSNKLSANGTRLIAEGSNLAKVFSIDSYGDFSYTSSNTAVAKVYGNIVVPVSSGETTLTAIQSASGATPQSTITATLTIEGNEVASTFSSSTFTVASSKTFGDASFAITTRPTSNSSGEITYSSSNTAVATIDASGDWITLVGAGDVSFNATQAATTEYLSSTITSNTLTVSKAIPTLSSTTFTVASSKTYGDASFAITTRPTSNSDGAITYTSSNPSVATIDACGNWITLVAAGDVSFNAVQSATAQYTSASITSNTLTVSKAIPTLEFVSPPITKNVTDVAFTVTASSASSGAVTYSSSNTSFAIVGVSTGIVTLKGVGTITITASQASTETYESPTNATCSIVIASAGTTLEGQTVSSSTSYESVDLSGASLVGTTVSGVSFSGANLSNVNFSGAVITNTNFTNANISGAINLPTFSTVQKLQLLKNINNVGISAVQVATTVSGSEINALLATADNMVAAATFTIKPPSSLDGSANKVVTISSVDISGGNSVYIPLNVNETVKINNVVYSFNGTNLLDASGNPKLYASFANVPFKIYVGSVVAVNIEGALNKMNILGYGLYEILSSIITPKT